MTNEKEKCSHLIMMWKSITFKLLESLEIISPRIHIKKKKPNKNSFSLKHRNFINKAMIFDVCSGQISLQRYYTQILSLHHRIFSILLRNTKLLYQKAFPAV